MRDIVCIKKINLFCISSQRHQTSLQQFTVYLIRLTRFLLGGAPSTPFSVPSINDVYFFLPSFFSPMIFGIRRSRVAISVVSVGFRTVFSPPSLPGVDNGNMIVEKDYLVHVQQHMAKTQN